MQNAECDRLHAGRRSASDSGQSAPNWLAPDGSKLAAPQRGRPRGPAYPAAAAARAAAATTRPGAVNGSADNGNTSDGSEDDGWDDSSEGAVPQGLGSMLSLEEMAELRSMAAADDLVLPSEPRLQRPARRQKMTGCVRSCPRQTW